MSEHLAWNLAFFLMALQAIIVAIQSCRLAFYKAYFDQKQRNRKIIEALQGRGETQ
jgi:hypothetical protein